MTSRGRTILAVAALTLAVASASFRIWDQLVDPHDAAVPRYALGDFRDAVYYASVAFLAGDNPYDGETYVPKYPVGERCSLYSPLSFVLHAPFALLPFLPAAFVFYVLSLVLTIGMGALCLHWAGVELTAPRVVGLGAFLVASRPGSMNLFNGQVTAEAVLATYVALWYARDRPWPAAIALAMATFKGTYGVPLAVLMGLRGDRRTVALAVVLGTLVTVPAAARLVYAVGGVQPVVASLRSVYDSRSTIERKRAERAPFRIDVVAFAGRLAHRSPSTAETLALSFGVLGAAAVGLRRLRRREEADDDGDADVVPAASADAATDLRLHATSLAALAITVGLYHQAYDGLALTLPAVVLAWRSDARPWRAHPTWRWITLGLVVVPFVNYFSAQAIVDRLGVGELGQLAASSVSAGCILAVLAIHVVLALRWPSARSAALKPRSAALKPRSAALDPRSAALDPRSTVLTAQ